MAKTDRPVATYDHLQKRKRPERTLAFSSNDDLSKEYEAAQTRLAITFDAAERDTIRKEIAEAKAKLLADPDTVLLRLRAVSRGGWMRLIREHPPTDDQNKESEKQGNGQLELNPETFWPAAVAACMVEPVGDVDRVTDLFDEWSNGDVGRLITTVRELNNAAHTVDLGN
jgi:hypothetical protein